MKLKNVIAFISFATFTSLVSSCGDSYMPITLVSLDEKTTYANNDTISLIKFTEGEKFNIKGGDGKYSIEVKDKSNNGDICIDDIYSSSNNILSLKPKTEGECFLYVNDANENSTRILVQVKNMDRLYTVVDVQTQVDGDKLEVGEKKTIEDDILNKATVKENGRFEFYYMNPNFDSGNLMIFPNEGSNEYKPAFFFQGKPYFNTEGNEVINFNIYYSLGQTQPDMIYSLTEKKDGEKTYFVLSEDVTADYRTKYPELETATLEYILETSSKTNN